MNTTERCRPGGAGRAFTRGHSLKEGCGWARASMPCPLFLIDSWGPDWFWSGLGRVERAERSRQLAAAVRDGWNDQAVRAVLLRIDPAQTTLF